MNTRRWGPSWKLTTTHPLSSPAPASTILPEGNSPVFMVRERTLGSLSMELSNDKVALGPRDICVKDRNQEKKEDREDRRKSEDVVS